MESHTDKFNEIMSDNGSFKPKYGEIPEKKITTSDVTMNEALSFTERMSEELTNYVIDKINKAKGRKNHYAENRELYVFCKNNGIESDIDPYDNYSDKQAEIDFTYNESDTYKALKPLESTKIEERECLVLSNEEEEEKNILTVQFDDNDEIKEIEY